MTSSAHPAAAADVVRVLTGAGLTVATAESLTGGQVAAALTSVPGASAVYLGGVVAYATEVKVQVLGVPAEVVEQHGVISAECALAMARGVRRLLDADVGVATTGVAGPARQEGHPLGTVFVAVAREGSERVVALAEPGGRHAVQRATVVQALGALAGMVDREEPDVR